MTGATGDLTPDETDSEFVPGELREVADPAHHADVTARQASEAPAQRGDLGTPDAMPEGGATNLAIADEGYGSEHGLSPEDPAYRVEPHPPGSAQGGHRHPSPPVDEGDERSEHEERF